MSTAVTDDTWMRPVAHDDAHAPRWTRLGTLDGPSEPIVDACGFVQTVPGAPGIDWWIAGDDRWYFPSREVTVRQSLYRSTPVVETRLRVKGGDVCHRAYAVTIGRGHDVVVVEVENTTGVPCGVAFAVRPFGVVEDTPIHEIVIDGASVRADGRIALILPRPPAGALAVTGAHGELADQVREGRATATSVREALCPLGLAQGVVVVPMAHRTSFRVLIPVPNGSLDIGDDLAQAASALPAAENVARGWQAQVRSAARFKLPDPRLQAVMDATPATLLATTSAAGASTHTSIWDGGFAPRWDLVATTAGALDRFGLHDRASLYLARAAAAWAETDRDNPQASWLIEAIATHLRGSEDVEFAQALVESVVQMLDVARRGETTRPEAFLAAATVLGVAGQERAANAARQAARSNAIESRHTTSDGHDIGNLVSLALNPQIEDPAKVFALVDWSLDQVSSTGCWVTGEHDANRHAIGVGAAVSSLACDLLAQGTSTHLRLVSHVPQPWYGRPFEAHDIATSRGKVGFAVRWHDRRAAMLWHIETADAINVTATGLDTAWSSTLDSGEALFGEFDVAPQAGARISGLQIGGKK